MTTYQRFKKMNIDHSAIGMAQNTFGKNYFCTPIGAEVIGEAGMDGIHYCFIKGFGEMVFAVSPSGFPGEQVHPIARNFEDLLRLLLACRSADAIEQTYMWDILCAFTLGIGNLWLTPYKQAATAVFYRGVSGTECNAYRNEWSDYTNQTYEEM